MAAQAAPDPNDPLNQAYAAAAGQPTGAAFPFTLLDDVRPNLTNRWLVKDLVPRAGIGVMYGDPGAGKTAAAIDLLMHVAAGRGYRGRRVEQAAVVYVILEGHYGVTNRVVAAREHLAVKGAPFAIVPVSADFRDVDNSAKAAAVATELVKTTPTMPVIVCVDTFQAALGAGGSDCDPRDVGALLEAVKAQIVAPGMTAMFVHHSGKDKSRGARGWSGLNAALDFELELNRDDDLRTLVVSKQRDGDDGQPTICFKLIPFHLGVDEYNDEVSTVVVEHLADGGKGKSARLTSTARAALEKLWNIIKHGKAWYLAPDPGDGSAMGNFAAGAAGIGSQGRDKVTTVAIWHNECVDVEPHISKAKNRKDRAVKFRAAMTELEEAGKINVRRSPDGEPTSVGPTR